MPLDPEERLRLTALLLEGKIQIVRGPDPERMEMQRRGTLGQYLSAEGARLIAIHETRKHETRKQECADAESSFPVPPSGMRELDDSGNGTDVS